METKSKNALAELRPGFVSLADIFGVDIVAGKLTYHEDFPQVKQKYRKSVMESLATAENPAELPPVELYLHKDGAVVPLDGFHRIRNAIARCEGDPESMWAKIRAVKAPNISMIDAQIRSGTQNIGDLRGNLTDLEFVLFVERLTNFGLERDDIVKKLGHGSQRLVKKIFYVLDATPDVLQGIKDGKISLETGAKIATKVAPEEQSNKVEEAGKIEKEKGGQAARTETGLRKDRVKLIKLKPLMEKVFSIWENWMAMNDKTLDTDEFVMGQMSAYLEVLQMDDMKTKEVKKVIQPQYDAYLEAENAGPATRGRPKKKKDDEE